MAGALMNIELLRKVQQHILEEPNRLVMDDWLLVVESSDQDDIDAADFAVDQQIPACGTVGCIAGWTVALSETPRGVGVFRRATELLSIEPLVAERLFYRDAIFDSRERRFVGAWPRNLNARWGAATTVKERAQIVSERIDRFIATDGLK